MMRRMGLGNFLPIGEDEIRRRVEENRRRGFDPSGNPIGTDGINWYDEDVRLSRQVGDIDAFRSLTDTERKDPL